MRRHGNAALSLNQRRRLARRVIEEGWSLAGAAKAAEVSERTAGKWVGRYRTWPNAHIWDDRQPAELRPGHVGAPDRIVVAAANRGGRRGRADRNALESASLPDTQLVRLQASPSQRPSPLARH
jgi:hypothetical protein